MPASMLIEWVLEGSLQCKASVGTPLQFSEVSDWRDFSTNFYFLGIKSKINELKYFILDWKADIMIIQEIHLNPEGKSQIIKPIEERDFSLDQKLHRRTPYFPPYEHPTPDLNLGDKFQIIKPIEQIGSLIDERDFSLDQKLHR
ncbi:hypothetical protein AVEN_28754-1 [Araneus ventricosus]|uniref:Endonuclease/exonuclease/phosphatase domain-containing protein n=1 Tax=Araneus ventricosus TaxID=182803 RepID=A0A4Y2SJW8_ARAVE|nr:hypothetical protein AVEN_28754-1 [Araneus ventricosus]